MIEKILPAIKFIFFNFDYFLFLSLIIIWLIIKKRPQSFLYKIIIASGNFFYKSFIKLTEIKIYKLLLVFFILNLIIRTIMAMLVKEIAVMEDIIAPHYLNLARSIYEGKGFTTQVIWNNFLQDPQIIRPDFFRLPLYPLLVSIFYKMFGLKFFIAELINVLAGSLLPIIAYWLAYILTQSKKIGALLLIFLSFNSLMIKWTTISYPELVYCCCGILLIIFLYKARDKINLSNILVGIFLALTYLTRPEGLYIFLPVIVFTYLYQQNKKDFLVKILLTVFGFLIISSPYLARNYIITGKPFYSDFDRISMVAYVDHDKLIESPQADYKNIYELAYKNPGHTLNFIFKKITSGIFSIPPKLISSYIITIFVIIGLIYAYQKNRKKYYFIWLTISFGFLIPVIAIGFEDRYHIILIVLFYFFASIGILKSYDYFKKQPLLQPLLIIYLVVFITLGGLKGIGQGTIPYIPHSFYKRFDSDKYFSDLKEFYAYVKDNTSQDDVIMVSRRPYGVNYFTQRPIIIFPFTDEPGVQQFIKKYQVKWLIWMGQPSKIDGKYFKFFLPNEIPVNIKPAFKNSAGNLFKVDYYQ